MHAYTRVFTYVHVCKQTLQKYLAKSPAAAVGSLRPGLDAQVEDRISRSSSLRRREHTSSPRGKIESSMHLHPDTTILLELDSERKRQEGGRGKSRERGNEGIAQKAASMYSFSTLILTLCLALFVLVCLTACRNKMRHRIMCLWMNGSLTLGDAVANRRSRKNPGMSRSFSREHLSAEVVRKEGGEWGHFGILCKGVRFV
jgi:hypothetical protein